ncbi:MAG: amino acid adenylation domain-containing protein [Eggerthellaceae bacterium]|nr:amino acid adenylation domain-containing protein [Eggerthellaceae bacterium]
MNNVLEWLEASAQTCPDKIAFADVEMEISYSELVERAKAVGTALCPLAEQRKPVVLFMDKTVNAICGLFGGVYAGCCYSFIDRRQPASRIAKIVERLEPEVVVVDGESEQNARESFPEGLRIARIEDLFAAEPDDELLAQRRGCAVSTDPLYVNFTSGSTGTPKGVVVGHASVIDFVPVFTETLGITSDDVFANQAPLDFDVSVKDIYSAIYLGATVHLIPREYFSVPVNLMDYLEQRKPTVLVWAVSALCFVSIMRGFDYKVPDTVRLVAFSGEVMPVKQLRVWRSALPGATFVNVYGPTEITCNCTYHFVERDFALDETIPIGRPFANERVFLVGEDGSEVSGPGTVGEIYVGGPTLALGYYRDPERTALSFVQNPLNSAYTDIVYKTGDLARYDENGDLVYLSRVDHQIKHMGQRIELGEIDAAAHAVEGVERACCLYDEKRKRIRLYYTGTIDKKDLAERLHDSLPPFMMPNNIKLVDQMPMTKNGKIDRQKLAEGGK